LANKGWNKLGSRTYRNLVDVQRLLQVTTQAADIANAQHRAPRQFLLDTQTVLVDFRPFALGGDVREADGSERARSDALVPDHVEGAQVGGGWRVAVESGSGVEGIARIPVQSVSAAHRGLAFAEGIPRESNPRRNGSTKARSTSFRH